jgi:hypothetical protein
MTEQAPLIRLMVDSGAFSVLHKGETVDLDAYCGFIEKSRKQLWQYVNLDDIESPETSAENLAVMKARGLTPIPVFHCSEPLQWLKKMIDDGEKYIALSKSDGDTLTDERQRELLDEAFKILWEHPDIKVHAMGFMSPALLQRYRARWYSADAASWSKAVTVLPSVK